MENEFYGNNALYEYIAKASPNNFLFYIDTISFMIVVDSKNYMPIFIIVDDRGPNIDSIYKNTCASYLKYISNILNIPFVWIQYHPETKIDNDTNVNILYYSPNSPQTHKKREAMPIKEIKEILKSDNINVEIRPKGYTKHVKKEYNDRPSSNFHLWQRDYLETGGFIIDIDLIRINPENKQILSIHELKRSYMEFDSWLPYGNDKKNYYALANLCAILHIKFSVIFNYKSKYPNEYDDISKLKIYNVYHKIGCDYKNNSLLFALAAIETPEQFVNNQVTTALQEAPIYPSMRSI